MMSPNPSPSPDGRLPAGALPFREVWAADTEFVAPSGERPRPICLVAKELYTGREIRQWRSEMGRHPPYPLGPETLLVAFYASAELGCHLALGWPMPARILDLHTEFRNLTNGRATPAGSGLLGALAAFGLDSMAGDEKADMRRLIMRGGPWDGSERQAILDYCASDVDALARLLPAMLPHLLASPKTLGQALLRGRYTAAVARMEWNGVPIDTAMWRRLNGRWGEIKGQLVEAVDRDYAVYDVGRFSSARFGEYLARNHIPWPRLESGALDLKDDTFRERARSHPQLAPLHELRHTLSQLRLSDLAMGSDGRNRCLLSPYRSRTGRNQPSNTRFIFGPSTWLRSLM